MDHTSRTLILSRTAVIAALAIAFAMVLSTALLSAFATRNLARTDELGSSAKQTVSAVTQVLVALAGAETALGDPEGARPDERAALASARLRLREEVLALGIHLGDRPDLRPYAEQLEWLSRDDAGPHLSMAGNAGEVGPAMSMALMARFAEMRRLLYTLQRQEFAALVEYSAAAAARARSIQSLNTGLIAIALTLAVAGAWLLLRRMRDLEGLITVCAWTRRVQWQGHWISFEEFLARRFNLRCTHGICDEAAGRIRDEVAKPEIPTDFRHG